MYTIQYLVPRSNSILHKDWKYGSSGNGKYCLFHICSIPRSVHFLVKSDCASPSKIPPVNSSTIPEKLCITRPAKNHASKLYHPGLFILRTPSYPTLMLSCVHEAGVDEILSTPAVPSNTNGIRILMLYIPATCTC